MKSGPEVEYIPRRRAVTRLRAALQGAAWEYIVLRNEIRWRLRLSRGQRTKWYFESTIAAVSRERGDESFFTEGSIFHELFAREAASVLGLPRMTHVGPVLFRAKLPLPLRPFLEVVRSA